MPSLIGLSIATLLAIGVVSGNDHHDERRRMINQNRTPGGHRDEHLLLESVDGIVGNNCDLRGSWYNQHGSELIINQSSHGRLIGEYRTAVRLRSNVERNPDEAEQIVDYAENDFAKVTGHVHGRVFTFQVFWPQKKSVTSWSGHCHRNCDFGWLKTDRDILYTNWLITSEVDQCEDYWSATRVGQDIFSRLPMKAGPRRANQPALVSSRN